MATWFTADLHLSHANIIRHCKRPFATTSLMNRALVENWNDRVGRDDTVYVLDDFAYRNTRSASGDLSALRGPSI